MNGSEQEERVPNRPFGRGLVLVTGASTGIECPCALKLL
jgi:hypothetical protein